MKTETTNQTLLSAHPDEINSIGKEKNAKRPPSEDIFRKVKVKNAINPPALSSKDESPTIPEANRNPEDVI